MSPAPGAEATISVRMYNVGFGDCFLIRIPTQQGQRRVLVDCGYHSQGKGKFSDSELVTQIKADLEGESLDVVIATHRHQDHISGFGETDLWREIGVEEVWLPFTAGKEAAQEEPALAAWERLIEGVPSLVDERGQLSPAAAKAMGAREPGEQQDAAFMLWNARTNAPGIENLLRGMRRKNGVVGPRRFLPEPGKDAPYELETPALPGVRVHVLGPPRDPKLRKQLSVPSHWGVAGSGDAGGLDGPAGSPFGREWRVPVDRLPGKRPFKDKSLQKIAGFNIDLLAAAKAVDGFLNGESLVLVLEVGAAKLLLTGDAEVGSWRNILGNPKALALASGATFLKVGHHGSHNATPLIFLKENLGRKTLAMISTQQGAGNYRKGIPRDALLDTLKERDISVVRSDVSTGQSAGAFAQPKDAKWIDCKIPC